MSSHSTEAASTHEWGHNAISSYTSEVASTDEWGHIAIGSHTGEEPASTSGWVLISTPEEAEEEAQDAAIANNGHHDARDDDHDAHGGVALTSASLELLNQQNGDGVGDGIPLYGRDTDNVQMWVAAVRAAQWLPVGSRAATHDTAAAATNGVLVEDIDDGWVLVSLSTSMEGPDDLLLGAGMQFDGDGDDYADNHR